jgi:hypothetical protein
MHVINTKTHALSVTGVLILGGSNICIVISGPLLAQLVLCGPVVQSQVPSEVSSSVLGSTKFRNVVQAPPPIHHVTMVVSKVRYFPLAYPIETTNKFELRL